MLDIALGVVIALVGVLLGAFSIDLFATSAGTRLWNVFRVLLVAAGLSVALGELPLLSPREAAAINWRSDVETALAEGRGARARLPARRDPVHRILA